MLDSDLILHCKKGKADAQKQLFYKYSPQLFKTALRYAKSKQDAEDVLQESWISIFNGLDNYKAQGKLISWMNTIVIHKAFKQYKKSWFKEDIRDIYEDVSFENPNVLEDLQAADVMKEINKLPEGYCEIFKLHVIDGYKHEEIGKMMGIATSTSRAKLTLAKKKLKNLIAKSIKVVG